MKSEARGGVSNVPPIMLLIIGVALNGSVACFTASPPRSSIVPDADRSYVLDAGEVLFFDGCIAAEIEAVSSAPSPGSPSTCSELRLRLRNVSKTEMFFKFLGFDFVLGPSSAHPANVAMLPPRQDFILSIGTAPFDPSLVSVAGTVRLGWGNRTESKDLLLVR
jgi:hypothetical protein